MHFLGTGTAAGGGREGRHLARVLPLPMAPQIGPFSLERLPGCHGENVPSWNHVGHGPLLGHLVLSGTVGGHPSAVVSARDRKAPISGFQGETMQVIVIAQRGG